MTSRHPPATGPDSRRTTGFRMEAVAARYLTKQGVRILEQNVLSRGGELDLIGEDGDTLVIFEVRFRKRDSLVSAVESIGYHKQQRLLRAAQVYIHRNRLWNRPCRIDIVAIAPGISSQYRVQWIKNAIQA